MVCKERDSDAQPRVWLVEGNSSRSVQLTGLGKYVLYEVQVLAFTRVGDGSPSHPPILERTLDDGEFECRGGWEAAWPSGVTFCPKGAMASGFSCEKPVTGGHQPRHRGC